MPRHGGSGRAGHLDAAGRQRTVSPSSSTHTTTVRTAAKSFAIASSLLLLRLPASAVAQNFTSPPGNNIPVTVTNLCPETLWPGIGTQAGAGPGIGGFELASGASVKMNVSYNWQGRVWGRTNCSFNANGTGPSNLNGVNGNGAACLTGDCMGVLDCQYTGAPPATLFETNNLGGQNNNQAFYDISLVDGYNLPLGVVLVCTAPNTTDIPPNLTNPACIATASYLDDPTRYGTFYSNSTYPIPWEMQQTNANVGGWCPWDLQAYPPSKPGDGVYPYPDSDIQRPVFDPCLSACAASGNAADCCTGSYDSPGSCSPSLYSQQAKAMCPDAYSYAFDDQTSTFIVPAGCGFEVIFCPKGRSTNIIQTFGPQLQAMAASGFASKDVLNDVSNVTFIETHGVGAGAALRPLYLWFSLVAMVLALVNGGIG